MPIELFILIKYKKKKLEHGKHPKMLPTLRRNDKNQSTSHT